MRRLALAFVGGGAAFAAFLLLIGPINWSASGDPSGSPDASPTTSATPSESPSASPSDDPREGDDCDANSSVASTLENMGFDDEDFVIGEDAIDWDVAQTAHVDRAFSSVPLQTENDLWEFLQADTAASAVAGELIGDDADPDTRQNWWVPVQFEVPIIYSGNNHWDGTDAVSGGELTVLAGDVWWFDISRSGCGLDPVDSIRAACGNVGFKDLGPAVHRK